MVRSRLAEWDARVRSEEQKQSHAIHISDSRLLHSLHNIKAMQYKGKGIVYDEAVGKKKLYMDMESLGVTPPCTTRYTQPYKGSIYEENRDGETA